MALTVFDLPHITDEMLRYLTVQDLAHCVLVSKTWFSYFTPLLWQDPILEHPHSSGLPAQLLGLKRHHVHVRSLRGHINLLQCLSEAPALLQPWTFPNIQALYDDVFDDDCASEQKIRGFKVLLTMRSLQELTLRNWRTGDEAFEVFLAGLENRPLEEPDLHEEEGKERVEGHCLPELRKLDAQGERLTGKDVLKILKACYGGATNYHGGDGSEDGDHKRQQGLKRPFQTLYLRFAMDHNEMATGNRLMLGGGRIAQRLEGLTTVTTNLIRRWVVVPSIGTSISTIMSTVKALGFAADAASITTMVRDLDVYVDFSEDQCQILPILLYQCPLLERLVLNMKGHGNKAKQVVDLLASGVCPRLKHLEIENLNWYRDDIIDSVDYYASTPSTLANHLIKSLGQERSPKSSSSNNPQQGSDMDHQCQDQEQDNYTVTHTYGTGLESLSLDVEDMFLYPKWDTARVLTNHPHHAATLTRLRLERVGILAFSVLMNGLPRLESVKAQIDLRCGPDVPINREGSTVDLYHGFDTMPWCCLQLKTLALGVLWMTGVPQSPPMQHQPSQSATQHDVGEESDLVTSRNSRQPLHERAQHHIMTQVGRMTSLQELGLRTRGDLQWVSLTEGCLEQWSELTELKGLCYEPRENGGRFDMREQEAEWICEHWPRIAEIVLAVYAAAKQFEDTMQQRRPRVIVKYGHTKSWEQFAW
ncbi:hypothetical protein EDD11_004257 [Mortierella claussenii]|nr:hypothetical protein EDD11_004257 [Mortierella claussenii]